MMIWQKGCVAIRKREDTGLLASLYEFPNLEGHLDETQLILSLDVKGAKIASLPPSKHIFSHVEWHMIAYRIDLEEELGGDYLWVTPQEIKKTYSLPGAFKAYTKLIR
jgi:A/G-specific adenine glycosylase